jgi:hypothetical protein
VFAAYNIAELALKIALHTLARGGKQRIKFVLIHQGIFGPFTLRFHFKGDIKHREGFLSKRD